MRKAANVKIKDIKSYNRNLEQIRKVGIELANDIQTQMNAQNSITSLMWNNLVVIQRLIGLPTKYGFESGEGSLQFFQGKALPPTR